MGPSTVELISDQLTVRVEPERGADIRSIIDRPSGIDVLYRTPWAGHARVTNKSLSSDSMHRFLADYQGGWQLLLPNGGDACVERGAEWGFHGEACAVAWHLDCADASSARMSVRLVTAPLKIERTVTVDGHRVRVEEKIINESPDSVEVMWSHHPALGSPLVAPGARVYTGARRLLADPIAPGNFLVPASFHDWPAVISAEGRRVDLSTIPGRETPRAALAYLGEFAAPFYAIVNPAINLGFGLRWDTSLFRYAWFWQELHATGDFPWFRRAYVMAIEPATTIPGHGAAYARRAGTPLLVLAGGECRSTILEAVVFHETRPVTAIRSGGHVEFATAASSTVRADFAEEFHQ